MESFNSGAFGSTDRRARLLCKGGTRLEDIFEGAEHGPMQPLIPDRGVVFPYVPTMMMSHQGRFGSHQPVHSNFVYKYFQNYELADFTVTCSFTSHTTTEALYTQGAMHFFKSAMKIGFGEHDPQRGIPPPVLEFSAWGPSWADRIPCVISNFTYNMDGTTDYVWPSPHSDTANQSLMPLKIEFILQLSPTYSTKSTRMTYTSESFYNGSLLRQGYS